MQTTHIADPVCGPAVTSASFLRKCKLRKEEQRETPPPPGRALVLATLKPGGGGAVTVAPIVSWSLTI